MSLSNREEYQAWRDHPLTKEFLTLLEDNHLSLTQAWGRGFHLTEAQQARCQTLGELAKLRYSKAECQENEASIEELMGADWTPEPQEKHNG